MYGDGHYCVRTTQLPKRAVAASGSFARKTKVLEQEQQEQTAFDSRSHLEQPAAVGRNSVNEKTAPLGGASASAAVRAAALREVLCWTGEGCEAGSSSGDASPVLDSSFAYVGAWTGAWLRETRAETLAELQKNAPRPKPVELELVTPHSHVRRR